jgi:hypothetical protein
MIILRSPKGWTCPKEIDGHPAEDNWRSHQVPLANARDTEEHTRLLESWLRSYRPDELFDATGAPVALATALAPAGDRRMSANPVTNGGLLRQALRFPPSSSGSVRLLGPPHIIDRGGPTRANSQFRITPRLSPSCGMRSTSTVRISLSIRRSLSAIASCTAARSTPRRPS